MLAFISLSVEKKKSFGASFCASFLVLLSIVMQASRKKTPTGTLVCEFFQFQKIHGLCHIQKGASRRKNVFWIFMAFLAFFVIAAHIYLHMDNFMSTFVSTRYKHRETDFIFPDVTMCSLSPTNRIMYERGNEATIMGLTSAEVVLLGILFDLDDIMQARKFHYERDIEIHQQFMWHQRSTGANYKRSFYPFNEMVFSCYYLGSKCDPSDFVLFQDPNYWNCYTFRPRSRIFSDTSPSNGLSLVLYSSGKVLPEIKIDTEASLNNFSFTKNNILNVTNILQKISPHENMESFYDMVFLRSSEPSGIKLTIHEPHSYPLCSSQGFIVANGDYVKIGLDMFKEIKINETGDPCSTSNESIYYRNQHWENGTISMRRYARDSTSCLFDEVQQIVRRKCDCYHSKYPLPMNIDRPLCHNYTNFLLHMLENSGSTYFSSHMKNEKHKSESKLTNYDFIRLFLLGRSLANKKSKSPLVKQFKNRLLCQEKDTDGLFRSLNEKCKRFFPCESFSYQHLVSNAPWPRRFDLARLVHDNILPNLRSRDQAANDSTEYQFNPLAGAFIRYDSLNHSRWVTHEDVIRQNFVKVVIHPLHLKSDVHVEEYTYTFSEALGEIGGIMSLWMGVSFLSMFEFVDFISTVFWNHRVRV